MPAGKGLYSGIGIGSRNFVSRHIYYNVFAFRLAADKIIRKLAFFIASFICSCVAPVTVNISQILFSHALAFPSDSCFLITYQMIDKE